jgi:ribosome maturation protein SDO1
MLLRRLAAAAAAAALATAAAANAPLSSAAAPPETTWQLVRLPDAPCLDGTPSTIYVKPGVGADASKLILFWEGGGWCASLLDCLARSKTPLGSSASYPNSTTHYSERDLLSPDCAENPAFCNYASVYAPYCDGASRSSLALAPVVVEGTPLHFSGFAVMRATMDALAAGPGFDMPPLSGVTELLVSGSSAGGLTTLLHLDYIAARAEAASPGIRVSGVPEVGFFVDAESIWQGRRLYTEVYARIAEFGNISGGLPEQLNEACVAAHPAPADRWHCFMAQYTYPYTRTPTFLLQSQVDAFQTANILAPDPNTTFNVYPYAPFAPCEANPGPPGVGGCNATQWKQFDGYAAQFFGALNASLAATPADVLARSGGVITSCAIHTTAIGGISHKIVVAGKTMYEHLVAWYSANAPLEGGAFVYDVPYPADKSCPKPTEPGELILL